MFRIRLMLALSLLITVGGCATIVGGGTSQPISFSSEPGSAAFVVKSSSGLQMAQGKTPTMIELPRKNEYQLEVTAPGYQPQTMVLTKGINGWFWANLLIGGPIGMVIDFVSGAAWKLEPSLVSVSLQKGSGDDANGMYSRITVMDAKGHVLNTKVTQLVPAQ